MANWDAVATIGRVLGPQDAKIRIVEFADFQCPFCARAAQQLKEIRERYPGQVAIEYRHFPLELIHPYAVTAALAAECAGAQGRFEAYHDMLYERQASIGTTGWTDMAEAAGVPDLRVFERCIEEAQFRDRVEQDATAGASVGVYGTPTFIFDGKLIAGVEAIAYLRRWIPAALKSN